MVYWPRSGRTFSRISSDVLFNCEQFVEETALGTPPPGIAAEEQATLAFVLCQDK